MRGAVLTLLGVLSILAISSSATAGRRGVPAPAADAGVLLVLVPSLTLDDVMVMPGLRRIAEGGCSALMSSRVGRPLDAPFVPVDFDPLISGYFTLATGARAAAGVGSALILQDSELYGGRTARQVWEFRHSQPGDGYRLFAPDFQAELRRAKAAPYPLEPGALGGHLAARGIAATVLGNADLPDAPLRPAALVVLDTSGRARSGIVGGEMTRRDPAFPFGLRTDREALLRRVEESLERYRFIVVETGDAFRYARYEAETLPGARSGMRKRVMESVDSIVSGCLDLLPAGWRLVVASPGQVFDEEELGASSLAPLLSFRRGEGPGLLTSGSTRRAGVVANTDLATAILHWLGAPAHIGSGQPMDVAPSASPLREVAAIRDEADYQSKTRGAVRGFVYLSSLAMAVAAALACARGGRSPLPSALSLAPPAALTGLLAAGVLRPPAPWGPALLAIGAAVASAAIRFRLARLRLTPALALVSASGVATFCLLGWLAGAPASYEIQGGARYYGLGNEYGGLFAGAMAVLAGALALRGGLGGIAGGAVMLAAAVFAGHPLLGANAGVMLGCLAGAAAILAASLPRRRWPAAAIACAAGLAAVAGLAVVDSFRPENLQSHFGRAVAGIRQEGAGAALDIILRKTSLNLMLLQRSPWALLLAAAAGGAAFVSWKCRRRAPAALWATAAALLVFNDSGVLAAAASTLWILPVLLESGNPAEKTLKKTG